MKYSLLRLYHLIDKTLSSEKNFFVVVVGGKGKKERMRERVEREMGNGKEGRGKEVTEGERERHT